MENLADKLNEIGKVRFIKYIHDTIWVAFMDHAKALDAVKVGSFEVCNNSEILRGHFR